MLNNLHRLFTLRLVLLLFISCNYVFAGDSLLIGEFYVTSIIDGDTFKFEKLDKSARLLCIDTEETFKGVNAEQRTSEISINWDELYRNKRKYGNKPIKIESPFGFETMIWTKNLFKDVVYVRLELDETSKSIDFYGRHLVYVIAIKSDESEFNYSIECVRQGYSPYFNKYGNSKRFHEEFAEAQNYAKNNKLGIWSNEELCYPDYEERLSWWNKRADALTTFETKYFRKPGYFSILDENDFNSLNSKIGEEIIIFGSLNQIMDKKDPYLLRFSHNKGKHFDVVLFPENYYLLEELNLTNLEGEYIYVKGTLIEYKGKPEIILTEKSQVWTE